MNQVFGLSDSDFTFKVVIFGDSQTGKTTLTHRFLTNLFKEDIQMSMKYYISIIVIVIAGIFGNFLRYTERSPDRMANFDQIPMEHSGYFGTERPIASRTIDFLGVDKTIMRNYRSAGGRQIELYCGYFSSQRYGSQIHSPKNCLPGGGWRIEYIEPYEIKSSNGQSKTVNHMIISQNNFRTVVLYWFETRSGAIGDEYGLKFDMVKNSLLFRPTDAAMIRITTSAQDGDFESATRDCVTFLREFEPFIYKALPF